MSRENVKKFFAELEKNSDLKEKYLSAMKEYHKESDKILTGKLIEVGKTSGFNFTDTDLHEAQAELMDKMNENGELNDVDLVKVAGGMSDHRKQMLAMSIITLGLGCAGISIIGECLRKGQCGAEMSTTQKC